MSAMIGNPLLLPDEGYNISRSVRLRSSASGNFSRTPASAGNRKKWTWSGWVKRGNLSTNNPILTAYTDANNRDVFQFDTATIQYVNISGGSANANLGTTAVFRDPSAWYHIVLAIDTTDATASNRIKIYVNSVQQTSFVSSTYPSQNADMMTNNNVASYLGREVNGGQFLDGYLTEINFIDGQALTPSSFGETDVLTGVWKPKKYTGTYGTNGFFLNFSDPSAASASAIGKDYSGNGNNWTPNNISVTSGSTYDSMLDVPTLWADGGNGRGNYGTLNATSIGADCTLSGGNLNFAYGSSGTRNCTMATIGMSSGKWYWEVLVTAQSASGAAAIGISSLPSASDMPNYPGFNASGWGYLSDGTRYNNLSGVSYGATYAANDVIGVAFDADVGSLVFYKNNTSQGTAYSSLTSGPYFPAIGDGSATNTWSGSINFGQRPFAYTPPTGFRALNTQNLPEPVIRRGNLWFDATLYTGNGSTLAVTGVGFQPDFVWLKSRGGARSHRLWDAVRGATNGLSSDLTNAEYTESGLTSFNTDGFTLGSQSGSNTNAEAYVAWNWKEGATPGFDIVTYTGTGANRTVAHSLGVYPSMMIIKNRSNAYNWAVYHGSLGSGATKYLQLNSTGAAGTSSTYWNNTEPNSANFTVGTSGDVNLSSNNYVAYLFAEVAGFSKFGSYTGNGSSDGPMIFTGFRPRFILLKRTDTTGNWNMYDSARSPRNADTKVLYPNLSNSEDASTDHFDWLSNGFKMKSTNQNTNGGTFIFAAFSENPFKYSLAQ